MIIKLYLQINIKGIKLFSSHVVGKKVLFGYFYPCITGLQEFVERSSLTL